MRSGFTEWCLTLMVSNSSHHKASKPISVTILILSPEKPRGLPGSVTGGLYERRLKAACFCWSPCTSTSTWLAKVRPKNGQSRIQNLKASRRPSTGSSHSNKDKNGNYLSRAELARSSITGFTEWWLTLVVSNSSHQRAFKPVLINEKWFYWLVVNSSGE